MSSLKPFVGALDVDGVYRVPAESILSNGLNIFYFVAGIASVIVIIIAGYMYATSAGNPQTTSKAKNAILYSVIGLVVIIFAFAITHFIFRSV